MAKPNPPVPRSLNLRNFPWMPLNIVELENSETWAMAASVPFAGYACINLWRRAWHQVPASSLPNDDRLLRKFADVPEDVWGEVRDIALRGFVECSDGRLYHMVLARKAIESGEQQERAAGAREGHRQRMKRWRSRKHQQDQGSRDGDGDDDVTWPFSSRDRHVTALIGEGEREEESTLRVGIKSSTDSPSSEPPPRKANARKSRFARYAFEGQVIRLTPAHFELWQKRFTHIRDLAAMLQSRDDFLAAKPPDDVGNWFVSTAAWLANKNERAAAERQTPSGDHQL